MESSHPNKAAVALIVIALLALAAAGVGYVITSRDSASTSTMNTSSTNADNTASTDSKTHGSYKDGTYQASAQYVSPGGNESVDLSVALKANKVVSADVVTHPASSTSSQYQGIFKDNFKPEVIGKPIDEIELHRVAGSSLTSGGFNAALEQIKTQAAK